jgi:hypothetical protein
MFDLCRVPPDPRVARPAPRLSATAPSGLELDAAGNSLALRAMLATAERLRESAKGAGIRKRDEKRESIRKAQEAFAKTAP